MRFSSSTKTSTEMSCCRLFSSDVAQNIALASARKHWTTVRFHFLLDFRKNNTHETLANKRNEKSCVPTRNDHKEKRDKEKK